MERLSNKVAVVTGGNSGIGLAAAKAFAAEGAAVLLVGRRAEAVDAAVRTIPGAHGLVALVDRAELVVLVLAHPCPLRQRWNASIHSAPFGGGEGSAMSSRRR